MGTTAKNPAGWVVWNVWNIPFVILLKKFVQSVVFGFFNQNAERLTNCKVYAILIIETRDITFAYGKRWTYGAERFLYI